MEEKQVYSQIRDFKKKFYVNLLIKGSIITLALLLGVYIAITSLEFFARLNSFGRGFFFFGFLVLALFLAYKFIAKPVLYLFHISSGISDENAARHIGTYFPSVSDRLLNFLQLKRYDDDNALVQASLKQRAQAFTTLSFTQAIDLRQNQHYLKYLAPSMLLFLLILLFVPQLFTTSTKRIVSYRQTFVPVAPFTFMPNEISLIAFKNEDHPVLLTLSGAGIPQNVYLVHKERRIKMAALGSGRFSYTFSRIQVSKRIHFEAAGFRSIEHIIKVVNRPNLRNFNVLLNYPAYLGKRPERIENIGNLNVPEGTRIKWQFNTLDTDTLNIAFDEEMYSVQTIDNQIFEFEKQFDKTTSYKLMLSNYYSRNKDVIGYQINVTPDEYPAINLNVYQDTVLYSFLVLGGNISDDYGITNLKLVYSVISGAGKEQTKESIAIPFNRNQSNQSFFYRWVLDSLDIHEGEHVSYYVQVWDNDGVNGIKSSKSGIYTFRMPTKEEIKVDIAESSAKTSDEMKKTLEAAEHLKKDLEDIENRLRGKKQLDWQDKKKLQELLEEKEMLNKAVEELKKQFEAQKLKKERFQQQSEAIKKKLDEIEKLINELLDEETRKLYEELQKLLEEELNNEKIQDLLDKINRKEDNLIRELERTLELFKRMKFAYELEETIQQLDNLTEEQKNLSEETRDKGNDLEEMQQKQEILNEEFDEFEKSLDELNELNQDLKNPHRLQDHSENIESIKEEMKKAKESLEKGKRKKAVESQQKSGQQMQRLSKQLQQMQGGMEMQMMQANLNDLRDILYNLIKLSFDQEELMKEFRTVDQVNPRFIDLGQWQLKIRDDAKIVEDSLLSLAKRAGQLRSFVTREVSEMNTHLDKSIQNVRDRRKSKAVSEQQFAMTSMNNLALMLDDVMAMMQQNLSEAMGNPKMNRKPGTPSLSELQKQLNQQIEQLKRSGKSGRELSEELAKLAAAQERIRKALQEMESQLNEGEGENRNATMQKMEQTEIDLVNKRLTEQTIRRQKEILTRLLEAENAMRERELDNEREGISAKEYERALPKAFEEYFKAKEKEIELLKTVPPKLYPYYKKEVNEYFRRIGNQNFD